MRIQDKAQLDKENVFGLGQPNTAYAQYFTGHSYLNPLTEAGRCPVFLANVTFEPGCRNNWHIHHAKSGGGQILICTAGEGWYQEDGKKSRQPDARHRRHHPGRGQALARSQKRQLVFPYRSGGARRGDIQRVVRAGG